MIAEESQATHSSAKQALLQKWRKGGYREVSIPRRERMDSATLSFGQQRLWFLDQLGEGKNAAYNMTAAVRLKGELQIAVLREALAEVMGRHEALRTTFAMVDGEPLQVISATGSVPWRLEDLSSEAVEEQGRHLQDLLSQEARAPFDLVRGPVLRACLVRLEPSTHVLMVTMHHIVSDGWSIGVLVREVAALYAARLRGEASPLAKLPIQYGDFAEWQRGWLQGETLQRQLEYWEKQLGPEPPRLELPSDRPRPAGQSFRGERHSFQFRPE